MTKKNKIITIFVSVLAIIVLLVVLSSTLFAVSSVKVEFQSSKNILASVDETEIAQSANIKKGTNVFLIEKSKAKNNLEKAYPYIKVLNIETKFPNKIVIHAVERDEVFAFQTTNKYYVTDSDFKVLRIVEGEFESLTTNAIKIDYDGEGAQVGEFLATDNKFLTLKTMENSNYQNFSKEESSIALSSFLATYKSVEVFDEKVVMNTFLGVKVCVYSPDFKQQEKLKMATIKLDSLTDEQKHQGVISIFQKDGIIIGTYGEHE